MIWQCMKCDRLYDDNPRMCDNCGYSIFSVDGTAEDPDALQRWDDSSDASLAETIVKAIATVKGVSPMEVPPLYDSVDPDAVESLFEHSDSHRIQFRHAGFDVVVTASGEIKLSSIDGSTGHA